MSLRRIVPIAGVLVLAIVIVVAMTMLRPKAKRSKGKDLEVAVDVYEVADGPWKAFVSATGIVVPGKQIELIPQITGSIVWISEKLMPGGRFAMGETIARIDARDFNIILQQEESKLRAAELEFEREKARQGIAKKEWEILGTGRNVDSVELALRKPQLAVAAFKVRAAASGVERAKLSLERTRLVAPFDAAVVNEAVDVGQLVGPGTKVARLMGTEEFWVTVAVPVSSLRWIKTEADGEPSLVTITHNLGQGRTTQRKGRVLRVVTQLNAQTRRAQVLVAVERPMDLHSGVPLLAGAFVSVQIEGNLVENSLKLPRSALRDGNIVWLVEDNKLKRLEVEPLWTTEESVFVDAGVERGHRILVSSLSLPIEGMRVRVRDVHQESGGRVSEVGLESREE